jgi:hypothetical protein
MDYDKLGIYNVISQAKATKILQKRIVKQVAEKVNGIFPGVVACTCNPSTGDDMARGLRVPG